jgi:hypothetical protein
MTGYTKTKKTVAVITNKGCVSTSAFFTTKHALENLDPFHFCLDREAVVRYFKAHPQQSDRDALCEIGNLAGRPDTHYASPSVRLTEANRKLEEIAKIVQTQLGAVRPPVDPDKYRSNPGIVRWRACK